MVIESGLGGGDGESVIMRSLTIQFRATIQNHHPNRIKSACHLVAMSFNILHSQSSQPIYLSMIMQTSSHDIYLLTSNPRS